jgi:hypothetical protein
MTTDLADPDIADDTLRGAAAIARHMGVNERRAQYLLEKSLLPAFKLGGIWTMRKSTYRAYIAHLEAEAQRRTAELVSA